MPLFLVQDSDRPMYLIAPDYAGALHGWQTQIAKENMPEGDVPHEKEIPKGIEYIADDNDILLVYEKEGIPAPIAQAKEPTPDPNMRDTIAKLRINFRDCKFKQEFKYDLTMVRPETFIVPTPLKSLEILMPECGIRITSMGVCHEDEHTHFIDMSMSANCPYRAIKALVANGWTLKLPNSDKESRTDWYKRQFTAQYNDRTMLLNAIEMWVVGLTDAPVLFK